MRSVVSLVRSQRSTRCGCAEQDDGDGEEEEERGGGGGRHRGCARHRKRGRAGDDVRTANNDVIRASYITILDRTLRRASAYYTMAQAMTLVEPYKSSFFLWHRRILHRVHKLRVGAVLAPRPLRHGLLDLLTS